MVFFFLQWQIFQYESVGCHFSKKVSFKCNHSKIIIIKNIKVFWNESFKKKGFPSIIAYFCLHYNPESKNGKWWSSNTNCFNPSKSCWFENFHPTKCETCGLGEKIFNRSCLVLRNPPTTQTTDLQLNGKECKLKSYPSYLTFDLFLNSSKVCYTHEKLIIIEITLLLNWKLICRVARQLANFFAVNRGFY